MGACTSNVESSRTRQELDAADFATKSNADDAPAFSTAEYLSCTDLTKLDCNGPNHAEFGFTDGKARYDAAPMGDEWAGFEASDLCTTLGLEIPLSFEENGITNSIRARDAEVKSKPSEDLEMEATSHIRKEKRGGAAPRPFAQWALSAFFLGRNLPDSYSKVADAEIIATLSHFMASPDTVDVDVRIRDVVMRFCEIHHARNDGTTVHIPDKLELLRNLHIVEIGGFWATWAQAQNAIIFVERLSKTRALIAAWPIQPAAEDVLRAVPGFMRLPEVAFEVNWEHIEAEPFMCRLAELASTPMKLKATQATLDVVNPSLVLDFLLPALGGDAVDLTEEHHCLAKKVRDESRINDAKRAWRRPPAWLALKSIMHFSCVRAFKHRGRAEFKSLMVTLLAECLRQGENSFADDSARIEAARKLARRLQKLQVSGAQMPAVSIGSKAVNSLMKPVWGRWRKLHEERVRTIISPENLDFTSDVAHTLCNCRPVLQEIKKQKAIVKRITPKAPSAVIRADKQSKKPFTSTLDCLRNTKDIDHDAIIIVLFDAERAVWLSWEQWDASGKRPVTDDELFQLLTLVKAYLLVAASVYKNDVEGRSRMVLTAVTVAMLVDRWACQEHSLLREYPVGLDEIGLAYLILYGAREKKLLHALEMYMVARTAKIGNGHASILHQELHQATFCVRFAQQSEDMRNALGDIQRKCESNREAKEKEVANILTQHTRLHEQGSKLPCHCSSPGIVMGKDAKGNSAGESKEARKMSQLSTYMQQKPSAFEACKRCDILGKANDLGVAFYETMLPEDQLLQWAVMFELQIPPKLAFLRDVLYVVVKFCAEGVTENKKAVGTWRSEDRLRTWVKQLPAEPCVQLGYQTPSSFWGQQSKHLDSLTMKGFMHITARESFVLGNAQEAVLIDQTDMKLLSKAPITSTKEFVKIETRDLRYQSLQFAIDSWVHSENDVVARKQHAHREVSAREFESFGCLRAGVRLQFPRLARALAQQALSFDHHGVLDLVTAMLMQVGPKGQVCSSSTGAWRRQAHEVLGCQNFCDDLCAHAEALMQQQASNWTRHLLMLVIVYIGRCVLEHAPNSVKASQLLKFCRGVACDWIYRVKAVMARSNGKDIRKLRGKLVEIAATAHLTYVSSCPTLLETSEHAATFIWLRAVLSDSLLVGNVQTTKKDLFRSNLLRKGLIVALEIEQTLYSIISKTNALTEFVGHHWSDAGSGKCGAWRQHPHPRKRWYETSFSGTAGKNTLQVDVLGGAFLVNGIPVGRLPGSITAHEDYVRLFSDAVLEVQPSSSGGWRTMAGPDGVGYSFNEPPHSGKDPVIIEERRLSDGTHVRSRFVSYRHFIGDVPDSLAEQYDHWLVLDDECSHVEFRLRPGQDANDSLACARDGPSFILQLPAGLIIDTRLSRNLVDIRSKSFAELYDNVFTRMAPRGMVHIFHSAKGAVVTLPQFQGLQFHVEGAKLRSHEYGSFVVPNQNFGTLVGLKHGLLLQEPTGERTLLMPHASASRTPGKQEVLVDIQNLRQPPLFVYNVRDDLCELHGQKDRLAWLYLAKLHALTSHPLPDPFLGQTGTAQALRVLASGRCRGNLDGSGGWASLVADTTLLEIARLSPSRKVIKKNNICVGEATDLRQHALPALCVHDGFAWLVRAMRREVKQAARFANNEAGKAHDEQDDELENRTGQLSHRAYLQSRELFAPDARLSLADENEILNMAALMSLRPLLIRFESCLDRKTAHAIAEPMHKQRVVTASADVAKLLHGPEIKSLRGHVGTAWHLRAMREWRGMLLPTTNSGASWLANVWIDLYEIARGCVGPDRSEQLSRLSFCLSFLAQEDPHMTEHLVQLGNVGVDAESFAKIKPPVHTSYSMPSDNRYQAILIERAIDDCFAASDRVDETKRAAYEEECNKSKQLIAADAEKAYKKGVDVTSASCAQRGVRDADKCASTINTYLRRWRTADELHKFVSKVQKQLRTISRQVQHNSCSDAPPSMPDEIDLQPRMFQLPYDIPDGVNVSPEAFELWSCGQYEPEQSICCASSALQVKDGQPTAELPIARGEEAVQVYERLLNPLRQGWRLASKLAKMQGHDILDRKKVEGNLQRFLKRSQSDMKSSLDLIRQTLRPKDDAGNALKESGLWPAVVPNVLLPKLLEKDCLSEPWCVAIGCFALLLRCKQRARRCLRLLYRDDLASLQKELSHISCAGWAPKQDPEWLLLELDNDFCIREQQATVAKEVISDDKGNRLLQLIMGAGKTAVIMPMVISSLADGQRLVRVSVIGPLYPTNAADWQLKLGGLLGRRIYPLVCERALKLERHGVELLALVKNICDKRHVIVTVPQHRLSLENKILELAATGDVGSSAALSQLQQFIASRGREVLDESDEILHPKFQLIYTLGQPIQLDGGAMRWIVASAVLHSVARHASDLLSEFGVQEIELYRNAGHGNQHFPSMRLLEKAKSSAYAKLCQLIVEDFLAGKHAHVPILLKPDEVESWRRAVLDKEAPDATWNTLTPELCKLTLLLRGILAHMVLFGALHKRWRVEYGGNPREGRRMAVPYRAKDVAAERTEFGHPDVVLLLTTLHYYYRGLSRKELEEALLRLARKGGPEAQAIYSSWVERAPALEVKSWVAVNLDDPEQFSVLLFPALHRHMLVIDFWLGHVAFPAEARQFGRKLISTAWDLCKADSPSVTTGFSGTDDAHLLLPLTIRQENMPELEATNGVLLHNLLRKENDGYIALPAGASGKQLLDLVSSNPEIDVLLDSGALVLELSNKEVAQIWLQARQDRNAAVYFEGDRIDVVDRFGLAVPLAVSSFERSMGDCLLYLDDEHTRGSDFRLPKGMCAVVTLGKGIQKDKLAQTVMRMRQLGHGHTVCFMASFEADLQISSWRRLVPERILSDDHQNLDSLNNLPSILSWCLSNTVSSTCDQILHLAAQGSAFIRKNHASSNFIEQPALMAENCAEREALTLEELYGYASSSSLVADLAKDLLNSTLKRLAGKVEASVFDLQAIIEAHLNALVPDVRRSSGNFDEEHERELELEAELEEEVESMEAAVSLTPLKPMLSDGLMEFATSGRLVREKFAPLVEPLRNTSFMHLLSEVWDSDVRVTSDFMTTVENERHKDSIRKGDSTLKSVSWILVARCGDTLLISNFEAEECAMYFLKRDGKTTLNMVSPAVRVHQPIALPSWPQHVEAPTAALVFAGSVHGDDEFLRCVHAFLGICPRLPSSPVWRELYERRGAINYDGFVPPEYRDEVSSALNVKFASPFARSPVQFFRCLYSARFQGEDFYSSPVGQVLCVTDGISKRISTMSLKMSPKIGPTIGKRFEQAKMKSQSNSSQTKRNTNA